MKRMLHILLTLVLILALFPAALAPSANASETYTISLPLTVNVTGSEPVPGAYAEFTLTALTEGAPMPDSADENGKIYLMLTETGENTQTVSITYPEMGIYQYTIQMTGGTYYHEDTQGTLYNLDVYNLSDDHDYSSETYNGPNFFQIYTEIGGEKQEKLEYECPLKDVTVYKRWVDNDSTPTRFITVLLLLDKEQVTVPVRVDGVNETYTYPELRLSLRSLWQGSWTGLDANAGNYTVKEKIVPPGYTASYGYKNGIHWITNTGSLLQTGQLNWPIPVLAGAGCLFLLVGAWMMRRKEEENA